MSTAVSLAAPTVRRTRRRPAAQRYPCPARTGRILPLHPGPSQRKRPGRASSSAIEGGLVSTTSTPRRSRPTDSSGTPGSSASSSPPKVRSSAPAGCSGVVRVHHRRSGGGGGVAHRLGGRHPPRAGARRARRPVPGDGWTARFPHYAFGNLAGASFGWFSCSRPPGRRHRGRGRAAVLVELRARPDPHRERHRRADRLGLPGRGVPDGGVHRPQPLRHPSAHPGQQRHHHLEGAHPHADDRVLFFTHFDTSNFTSHGFARTAPGASSRR